VEILQVRGLPVLIRRDPTSLPPTCSVSPSGAEGASGRAEGASGWAEGASGWAEGASGSGVSSILMEG
jgi:hypothetical protein